MTRHRFPFSALCCMLAIPAIGTRVHAQVIETKTIPLATGEQFQLFPSRNAGMGGVSIALTDPMLDPFVNPAAGDRVAATRLWTTPVFYDISENAGGGRTLPIGLQSKGGRVFGTFAATLQQLNSGQQFGGPIILAASDVACCVAPRNDNTLSNRAATNQYAFGSIGTRIGGADSHVALGASVFAAGLRKVDGIDFLYPFAQSVQQRGHDVDARLGLVNDRPDGRSREAVLLYDNYEMRHDASFATFWWDPIARMGGRGERIEHNIDRTDTWGVHLAARQPLADTTYRIGFTLTGNYKHHPHSPNYQIMNVPRDPGYTRAFGAGVGIARIVGATMFGVDAEYQPTWSRTWADSTGWWPGATSQLEWRTVTRINNTFQFSNANLRMGVTRDLMLGPVAEQQHASFSLGMAVRSIDYHLVQKDIFAASPRTQNESWIEWTPTWGLSLHFPELEVRYAGHRTSGTGIPGTAFSRGVLDAATPSAAGRSIVVAPSAPLTLQEVRVISHQIMVSVPLK